MAQTSAQRSTRRVVARERNVLKVDFSKPPEPPAPKFPGTAALRPEPADHPDKLEFTDDFCRTTLFPRGRWAA